MNHLIATLPFILFSLVVIVLLTCSDPRRRQQQQKHSGHSKLGFGLSSRARKWLAWSLVLPVLPLVFSGNYAGLLMYAGAVTVIGWLVVELPVSAM